jgi:hypothetical protein
MLNGRRGVRKMVIVPAGLNHPYSDHHHPRTNSKGEEIMFTGAKSEIEFEKCVVMAQQVLGIMIAIDDDLDKPTVLSVLSSMLGDKDALDQQERDAATAILKKLAKRMN